MRGSWSEGQWAAEVVYGQQRATAEVWGQQKCEQILQCRRGRQSVLEKHFTLNINHLPSK